MATPPPQLSQGIYSSFKLPKPGLSAQGGLPPGYFSFGPQGVPNMNAFLFPKGANHFSLMGAGAFNHSMALFGPVLSGVDLPEGLSPEAAANIMINSQFSIKPEVISVIILNLREIFFSIFLGSRFK